MVFKTARVLLAWREIGQGSESTKRPPISREASTSVEGDHIRPLLLLLLMLLKPVACAK